jgi:non-heme chloroperoxidase
MDKSSDQSGFVSVNGIKLHYLDWGGEGDTLLFLPGLGNTAYIFDRIAKRFTDRFHVFALTRRGHGDSDYPETGYDLETLTEDIRQFLDALNIDRAIFAGSSIAHMEICHFAALYPERVIKVIYFDAAYDRRKFKILEAQYPLKNIRPPGADDPCYSIEEYVAYTKRMSPEIAEIWGDLYAEEILHEIKISAEGRVVDRMSDELSQLFINISRNYTPEDTKTIAPVVSFYALANISILPDYLTDEQKSQLLKYRKEIRLPILRECIEQFRHDVPHAKIIEIPKGHHWCFIKHEELVYDEMRKFLFE